MILAAEGLYAGVRLTGSSEVFLANGNLLDHKNVVKQKQKLNWGWDRTKQGENSKRNEQNKVKMTIVKTGGEQNELLNSWNALVKWTFNLTY